MNEIVITMAHTPSESASTRVVLRSSSGSPVNGFLKGSTTRDEIRSIRFLGKDAAVVVSETGILFPGETQVPADRLANATWVLEKRNDKWLLAAYHNSPANAG